MPTIAPRFNPEGVRVGSMPVPDVKPAMGAANSLAAIGDTIANLGQTMDRVQDNQARRQAFAEAAAREKQRAAETAAADLSMEWKSRNELRREQFNRKGLGGKVYDEYDSFTKALESDTGQDLLKDKSPEVVTEFNRRTNLYRRDIQSAADQHAFVQNQAYTKITSERELQTSASAASLAIASKDQAGYVAHLAQAATAARRLGDTTGMPVDEAGLVGGIHYEALRVLVQQDPRQAVDFHKMHGSKFGKFADDAGRAVAAAQDAVVAEDASDTAASMAQQDNGLVDFSQAYADAAKYPGMDDKRIEMANSKLKSMEVAQNQRRTQAGQDAISAAMELSQQPLQVKHEGLKNEKYQYLKTIAQPEQMEAIRAAEQDVSNRASVSGLMQSALYGDREAKDLFLQRAAQGFSQEPLSRADRERFYKIAEDLRQSKGDPLRESISRIYRQELRRNGKPVPPSYTGTPDSTEKTLNEQFMADVDSVYMEVSESKSIDWKDDNAVKNLIYRRMNTTVERPDGGMFGGGVQQIPAVSLYDPKNPPTAEQMKAAGLTGREGWTQIAVAMEAYRMREAAKQAATAQQAKAQAEASAAFNETPAGRRALIKANPNQYPLESYWQREIDAFRTRNNLPITP